MINDVYSGYSAGLLIMQPCLSNGCAEIPNNKSSFSRPKRKRKESLLDDFGRRHNMKVHKSPLDFQ